MVRRGIKNSLIYGIDTTPGPFSLRSSVTMCCDTEHRLMKILNLLRSLARIADLTVTTADGNYFLNLLQLLSLDRDPPWPRVMICL